MPIRLSLCLCAHVSRVQSHHVYLPIVHEVQLYLDEVPRLTPRLVMKSPPTSLAQVLHHDDGSQITCDWYPAEPVSPRKPYLFDIP